MKIWVLIIILLAACAGCDKDEIIDEESRTELLTQHEWVLTGHGFDSNKNNVLDPSENVIEDCQKDNSYVFNINGTGSAFDNAVTCGTPVSHDFEWQLLNNDTELEIDYEKLFIEKLNERDLVLNPNLPGEVEKYILVYRSEF